MHRAIRSALSTIVASAALIAFAPPAPSAAQELPPPQPITLECATNASVQVLGSTPVHDGDETLVLVRVLFGPDGSLGPHSHPGTLTVTVESGEFGYTLLEESDLATITRAASEGTDPVEEEPVVGEQVVLEPGDAFIDTNRVHTATNLSDGETTVLFAGLVKTGEPITSCAEEGTPAAA